MPRTEEKRPPRWPMRLVLSLVLVVDCFLLIMLVVEGSLSNIPMTVNSAGLIVLCVLAWREIRWSRWILVAFLVWRAATIVIAVALHFAPGDHRLGGSMLMLAFYVAVGLVIASPLGRPRLNATHPPAVQGPDSEQ